MSTAREMPVTADRDGAALSADDAWGTLSRHGGWRLLRDAVRRFGYADGYSHARALALQYCLALIPLGIALAGLADTLPQQHVGEVVRETLLRTAPGPTRQLVAEALGNRPARQGGLAGRLALAGGAGTGLVALVLAMAQLERGANRIYGIRQDRPARERYLLAIRLALTAGLASLGGFALLVLGGSLGAALRSVYGWQGAAPTLFGVLRWPVGAALALLSTTWVFQRAVRRRQPAYSWLVFGAVGAVVLWLVATGLLAAYVTVSTGFGAAYGPLTGVLALLVWANLTSVTLLLGLAFAAQLEAVRAGCPDPHSP